MNTISRVLTGSVIIVLSILFVTFLGFFNESGINYFSVVIGFFFFIVGFVILFNKKEDDIEKIKKKK